MIKWHSTKEEPPFDGQPLLLWYKGAKWPVMGTAYRTETEFAPVSEWSFYSAQARGVLWSYWAIIHNPSGKEIKK